MQKTKTVEMHLKKCNPCKCKTFFRMFGKFYGNQPVDAFVVNCPYRRDDNYCINEKENLTVTLLPKLNIPKPTKEELEAIRLTNMKIQTMLINAKANSRVVKR